MPGSVPVICVFCGAAEGSDPIYLSAARALAHRLHENGAHLVYGGGTRGLMGELARTLVALSGPHSVHGIIPRVLVEVEEGYTSTAKEMILSSGGQGSPGEQGAAAKGPERAISAGHDPELEFGRVTVVETMHARKAMMADLVRGGGPGSGFVALAGGLGTLEEAMEMATWNQLGIHGLSVVLVNVGGYWDGLVQWLTRAVSDDFLSRTDAEGLMVVDGVEDVLGKLKEYSDRNKELKLNWT